MSLICPLCGKNKTDESLFCPDCTVKLNSEYELNVPAPEASQETTPDVKVEETYQKSQVEESEIVVPVTRLDPKAWKKKKEDERSESEKSYYEISRDKKTNKVRFTMIFLFVLTLVLVAALYIYNQHVKDGNLERAQWELAQRTNTIDSYLGYMDEYPQGSYVSEAYSNMMSLKNNETEDWQNLMTSESTIEFTDFLEKYPQSPFERKVKSRLDSLTWEASLKENSTEAYSVYIDMVAKGDILGDYIGEAQKRLVMLKQTTPIDKVEMETLQAKVDGFFTALSNVSATDLSEYLAPMIVRFDRFTNLSNGEMIGQLMLLAAKAEAKSLRYDPEITKLNYEKMGNDTYNVNVPVQKILEDNNGGVNQIKGYIVHLKLDSDFKIFSIHETKPFPTAP